jgi:heterogeneous nuclear ribonucleoprotein A1/A3
LYLLEIFMQNKIYVGNLSYSLDEASLRQSFAEFGEITDIAFPKDRVTGRPRGFAFITFADAKSAEGALKLDGQEIGGRKVVVKFALERKATGGSGGAGGGRRGESRW